MTTSWSTSDPIRIPAPVRSRHEAIELLHAFVQPPLRPETWFVPLDDRGVGGVALVINDTIDPDALLHVVAGCAAAAAANGFNRMFVATVRPDGDLLSDDDDRWLAACDLAADHDVELLDWVVIGPGGAHFPSDLVDALRPWPVSAQ